MNTRKPKSFYGVGVNDIGYRPNIGSIVVDGKVKNLRCQIYDTWFYMIKRCYSAERQQLSPAYIGCTVSPEWHLFSNFKAWMESQDWKGKQLDKDLLVPGNTVYSPETCVFLGSEVNKLMSRGAASLGGGLIGCTKKSGISKFIAQCRNPVSGKRKHLGSFDTAEQAHEAWREFKHSLALMYADRESDPRIADALRTRYAKSV